MDSKLNENNLILVKGNDKNKIEDEKTHDIEPLLDPKNARFTIQPIQYDEIWEMYKKQQNCYWKAEEINFASDYDDFCSLSENEQHFVKMVLAFFASSDGIVNFNLRERFLNDVQVLEAQVVYGWQMMMENIHCVSHNTQILTDTGYITIGDYVNKNIKVWNGEEFSDTIIRYTGDSILYNVVLSNGMTLECTPKHKWFSNGIVFTDQLKIGTIIDDYDFPIIDNDNDNTENKDPDTFMNPFIHGYYCGSGMIDVSNNEPMICLHNHNNHLFDKLNLDFKSCDFEKYKTFYITNHINKKHLFVPINYSLKTKNEWLDGLIKSCNGRISSINNDFIKNVQLLLSTMGKKSCITKEKDIFYVLDIDDDDTVGVVCVKEIVKLNGIHKTYCFNEPKKHAGVFNGILTGQSEVYSNMLTNIVKDPIERNNLFNAIKTVKSVKKMADWTLKWVNTDDSFSKRILAFAIVEGIFFSGAFAAIFWLKKYRSKGEHFMNGLIKSNEFISRDEGLHCDFAVMLYGMLKNRLSKEEVHEMFKEAVEISCTFTDDAIPCKMIGMNQDLMKQYQEYIADRLLGMLQYQKIYNSINPFKFMESIGLSKKTNFFEHRPTEYQSSNTNDNVTGKDLFVLDDF